MTAAEILLMDQWTQILDRECPLHPEQRYPPLGSETLAIMLAQPPFMRRFEGEPGAIAHDLADLPGDLIADIQTLGLRFAQVMKVGSVRVRIERTDSNACRKDHADHTDVRLITTYAGVGSQWLEEGAMDRTQLGQANAEPQDARLIHQLGSGDVALLKGEKWHGNEGFGLIHRSPQPAPGERRLLLTLEWLG